MTSILRHPVPHASYYLAFHFVNFNNAPVTAVDMAHSGTPKEELEMLLILKAIRDRLWISNLTLLGLFSCRSRRMDHPYGHFSSLSSV
jgi:hypothetical protein